MTLTGSELKKAIRGGGRYPDMRQVRHAHAEPLEGAKSGKHANAGYFATPGILAKANGTASNECGVTAIDGGKISGLRANLGLVASGLAWAQPQT